MNKNKIINFPKYTNKKNKSISKGFAIFNEGVVFYDQDKYDLAYQKFIEAEKLGYKSIDLYNNIIYILSLDLEKNKERLLKYINKSIKYDDENEYAYFIKGYVLLQIEDFEQALEAFLKAYKMGYDAPLIYIYISKTYYQLNNYLKEIAFISKGLNKYPNNKECLNQKGDSYYWHEEYSKALKYYLKAEEQGLVDTELYYHISYCYSKARDFKKALIYANKEIFIDKTGAYGYYRKGFTHYEAGNIDAALEAYLEAEKFDHNYRTFYDMYLNMSEIYLDKNDYEKALKYIDKAIALENKNAQFYFYKGYILYKQKKYSEALKLYKKAYCLGENSTDLIVEMSNVYVIQKKYKLALELLNKHLPTSQDKNMLLSIKAGVLYKLNRSSESKSILRKLYKIDPTNHWIIQAYGIALTEEKQYQKAIKRLEPIVDKLAEINPFSYFSLSLSYFKTKRYKESLNILTKYAKYEELEDLEYKDKQEIKRLVNNLYKIFGLNDELKSIINKFSPVIIFPKYI